MKVYKTHIISTICRFPAPCLFLLAVYKTHIISTICRYYALPYCVYRL